MTTRRRFLSRTAALAAGAFLAPGLTPALAARSPRVLPAGARRDGGLPRTLVVVELAGGNDGLNTVVPAGDDAYHAARGELAITDGLALDEHRALHPALGALHRHFAEGRLAVVEGVGYTEPNRSHFLSRDIWHAGDRRGRGRGDGWLGRLAAAHLDDPDAVVCVGKDVPYACRVAGRSPLSLESAAGFGLLGGRKPLTGGVEMHDAMTDAKHDAMSAATTAGHDGRELAEIAERELVQAREASAQVRAAVDAHEPGAEYPDEDLADDLRLAAALVASGLGPRVITVKRGGFDTHSNQRNRQRALLRELDASLDAFHADLAAHGVADRVVVLVWSEFGRRVAPNGSGGTDHGTAGPVFLLGDGVRGGLHGAPPSLTELDDKGDLVHTTDFRRVYASLLRDWFDVDPAPLLGPADDGPWAPLDLLG